MKRAANLFDSICCIQNLHEAYYKASKKKRLKKDFLLFRTSYESNLELLRKELIGNTYLHGGYRQFEIFEPKSRIISVSDFRDRIVHHAVINILEPVFERQFVYQTYACRKNKGTHKAALYALKKTKNNKFFLKLDIKKYFDSINHIVLKCKLSNIIKDERCLNLLFLIIDSYCISVNSKDKAGLPIGNLTSQFFANFYLSSLDHFILEKLKVSGFVRYMDDIVIFDNSKNKLKTVYTEMEKYCKEILFLTFNPVILDKTVNCVPFLGWKLSPSGIGLLNKTKSRMKQKIRTIQNELEKGMVSREKALERIIAVFAARKVFH